MLHAREEVKFETPRVLVVDDWAMHKDQKYGCWGFLKTHKRALTNCSTKVREDGMHLAVHKLVNMHRGAVRGKGDLIG